MSVQTYHQFMTFPTTMLPRMDRSAHRAACNACDAVETYFYVFTHRFFPSSFQPWKRYTEV